MDIRDTCRARAIAKFGATTPFLVPSYSSLGFEDVRDIHTLTKDFLFDACLVSVYDLAHGFLQEGEIYATDLLILDSGGYEARGAIDYLEPYKREQNTRAWTSEQYEQVLQSLEPLSSVVFVSFDFVPSQPIVDQISRARELFSARPAFASDFLCKPGAAEAPFIDTSAVIASVDDLAQFDLVGFTEKELGPSLLDRCRNLVLIRQALHLGGHQTPIHIFGSLDPTTVLAYFLCGADVFDGLAWLRFAFREGIPTYHATSIVADRRWQVRDDDAVIVHRVRNLTWLRDQQRHMRAFGRRHSREALGPLQLMLRQVAPLVLAAGVELEE